MRAWYSLVVYSISERAPRRALHAISINQVPGNPGQLRGPLRGQNQQLITPANSYPRRQPTATVEAENERTRERVNPGVEDIVVTPRDTLSFHVIPCVTRQGFGGERTRLRYSCRCRSSTYGDTYAGAEYYGNYLSSW